MRAAAVALVLVVGAIVVLWFGNTLNSWVLGGLVGGFAALLISIPISVALFLHLSRRHDEKMRAEAAENYYPEPLYREERVEQVAVYEADADVFDLDADEDEEWYEEDERDFARERSLPAPSYSRVPAVRQSQALMGSDMVARRNSTSVPSMRRPSPQRQYGYGSGASRSGGSPTRSQHLTAALRAARLEALQQAEEDMEDMGGFGPTTSRKIPAIRSNSSAMRASEQLARQPMRQFQSPFPSTNQYRERGRKIVDGTSMPAISRSLPAAGETSANRATQHMARGSEPQTGQIHESDLQTGQIRDLYPRTGPMRQQPHTGQIARNPRVEDQPSDPERVSGSLQNPMVRRAPYMYEDDPMRQQFAQQLDEPPVRRSSRKLRFEEAQD